MALWAASQGLRTSRPSDQARGGLKQRIGSRGLVIGVLVAQFLSLLVLVMLAPGSVLAHALLIVLALSAMGLQGVLGYQVGLSALDRLPQVLIGFVLATGTLASAFAWLSSDQVALEALRFGPMAFLVSWSTLAATYALGRYARARGWFVDRAIVLGSGRVAAHLEEAVAQRPEYGLQLVGFVTSSAEAAPESKYLGAPDQLLEACWSKDARVIIVAYSRDSEAALLGPIRQCIAAHRRVLVVPRFYEDLNRRQVGFGVWDLPLQRLAMPTAGRPRQAAKRALDVALAGTAFVVLLPMMAACALAARLETGSVLFRQTRVGQDERPIEILKFQTLKPLTGTESDTTWNISADERLGPFGSFMRKTSLDELPQLINVLRGDMSLVGPRPERPYFVEQFKETVPGYSSRHRVQVGLTGLAQVHRLRGDSSIEDRVRFDNAYVSSWSPWEDVKIMLRTVPELFRRSGG